MIDINKLNISLINKFYLVRYLFIKQNYFDYLNYSFMYFKLWGKWTDLSHNFIPIQLYKYINDLYINKDDNKLKLHYYRFKINDDTFSLYYNMEKDMYCLSLVESKDDIKLPIRKFINKNELSLYLSDLLNLKNTLLNMK